MWLESRYLADMFFFAKFPILSFKVSYDVNYRFFLAVAMLYVITYIPVYNVIRNYLHSCLAKTNHL